MKFIFY